MAKVAVLGMGTMGREMALRLLGAGHDVTVWNRSRAKTEGLGAAVADTPAQAVKGAEAIVTIVSDDAASKAVWLGPEGVLAGRPARNAVAVESSTLSRGWMLELAAAVQGVGLRFLDCPVTGGPDGAREGRLTLLVGGENSVLEAAWPILSAYAARHIHFGPVGAGTAYKLTVNMIGAAQAVAAMEGYLAAVKAGLDPETVCEALSSGAIASPMVKYLVRRLVDGDHADVYFSTVLRHKDARYGLRLAAEVGQAAPVNAAAAEVFQQALSKGYGDLNESIVVKVLR
ncbi:MAG: NAD(P)-dependent oxidoreductase [Magnetospirillum sp. WYHS-4]